MTCELPPGWKCDAGVHSRPWTDDEVIALITKAEPLWGRFGGRDEMLKEWETHRPMRTVGFCPNGNTEVQIADRPQRRRLLDED